MNRFVHLHVHSEYSLFDGCVSVDHLFNKAKRARMSSLAVTDHHNLFSWFHMAMSAKKHSVDPIFGCELNVGRDHITALACNEMGARNLILLNNIGFLKSGRPKISEKELKIHSDGIFFLSGCQNGKLPKLLKNRHFPAVLETARTYKHWFGGRFALEVQNYGSPMNRAIYKAFVSLGTKMEVAVVPTNDCHFLDKDDYDHHKNLVLLHAKGKVAPKNTEYYFKDADEMASCFPPEVLETTLRMEKANEFDFGDYLRGQEGAIRLPLCRIYRYGDAEALKKALYFAGDYKLAEYMFKKMKKGDLTLEDLYQDGKISEAIHFAYGLRGKISSIEQDEKRFIKTNGSFPVYRNSKSAPMCAQTDFETAELLGLHVGRADKLIVFV